jgi:hypothetical protein
MQQAQQQKEKGIKAIESYLNDKMYTNYTPTKIITAIDMMWRSVLLPALIKLGEFAEND